jgi:hypothetical protein
VAWFGKAKKDAGDELQDHVAQEPVVYPSGEAMLPAEPMTVRHTPA